MLRIAPSRFNRPHHVVAFITMLIAVGVTLAQASKSVASGKDVLIGASLPLSGTKANYGQGLKFGLETAFAEMNRQTSNSRYRLVLLFADDGGMPDRAVANVRSMLNKNTDLLALTAITGKAAESVAPMLENARIPMIGVASGSQSVRFPVNRWLFNLRAGSRDQAFASVLLSDSIGISKIALVSQTGEFEGEDAQIVRGLRPTASVRLPAPASADAIAHAIETVRASGPQATLLALDSPTALAFIRQSRQSGFATLFYILYDSSVDLLGNAGNPELAGVSVAQVFPHFSSVTPLMFEYRRVVPEVNRNYATIEGYVYGRVIAQAVQRCNTDLTRACLRDALEGAPLDIGEYQLRFSPDDHRGSFYTDMTFVGRDGKLRH